MSTQTQFMFELIRLVKEKIAEHLAAVHHDDHLFSHLFDEVILFCNELKGIFEGNGLFLMAECNAIDMFKVQPHFDKVIQIERLSKKAISRIFSYEPRLTY
jgi:hypothetical protein